MTEHTVWPIESAVKPRGKDVVAAVFVANHVVEFTKIWRSVFGYGQCGDVDQQKSGEEQLVGCPE
jgi:hypothetical protein